MNRHWRILEQKNPFLGLLDFANNMYHEYAQAISGQLDSEDSNFGRNELVH